MIANANFFLPEEVQRKLADLQKKERSPAALSALSQIIENAEIAPAEKLPLCQDTGTAVFFVEIGHQVATEKPLAEILELATAEAYADNYLRASIVRDPLYHRKNTGNNCPPVIHLEQVEGDRLKIFFLPKGGGAENKSVVKMLRPVDGEAGIIRTVTDAAKAAGGSACPPWIIGVGLGGTFDSVAFLAKKAILRPLDIPHPVAEYARLEQRITDEVNALQIGALGFGGSETVLKVQIETSPTHIAGLPVAVNFQCHSARSSFLEL